MLNSQCSILIRKGKRPHVCGGTFGNPTGFSMDDPLGARAKITWQNAGSGGCVRRNIWQSDIHFG